MRSSYMYDWVATSVDFAVTNTIKCLRAEQGFTQEDIATMTGISLRKIIAFESMDRPIDPQSLLLIARALYVPINALFCVEYDEFAHNKEMLQLMRRISKLTDGDRDIISKTITQMMQREPYAI